MASSTQPDTHPPSISVSIITEGNEEYCGKAWLDTTVRENWIARELASMLGQQLSQDSRGPSEQWEGQELQSVGVVQFDWCRTDIAAQRTYRTCFHVATDSSALNGDKFMLIGNDTLSKEKGLGRGDGAFPLVHKDKKLTEGIHPLSSKPRWDRTDLDLENQKAEDQRRKEYEEDRKKANEGIQSRQPSGETQSSTSVQGSSSAAGGAQGS